MLASVNNSGRRALPVRQGGVRECGELQPLFVLGRILIMLKTLTPEERVYTVLRAESLLRVYGHYFPPPTVEHDYSDVQGGDR